MVCAFSGHRPEKLPWGTQTRDPRCLALQQRLRETIEELADEGYTTFLCGMARGCDQYFFDAVRQLRLYRSLRLVAVVPCPTQAARWPQIDREWYADALEAADEVQLLSMQYYPGCMIMRNQHMVARAQLLLTVWDGSPGGTGSTIAYALEQGVPVRAIWR